ncbi:MAG: hypothetical protein OQJ81_04475, partial [Melioribacteraceae bacterium]|nr:hypothetical protein [Melioribacteraceae bacterium]
LVIFSIVLTNCSDSIVESTPSIDEKVEPQLESPTFTNIQKEILNKSCAFSGCHVSGSVNPNLAGNSYDIIVNKKSSTGMDYIKPNDPDNSYILQKILGSNGIQGSRMPLNSSSLSQDKIDVITEWINDGAKNN